MDEALYFENREQWRAWLEKNHDKKTEVWLRHYKKGSRQKGIALAESVEEALCFGWIDGKLKKMDEESYILRLCPRKPGSVWSKINKERAERMMDSGKMTSRGLAAVEEAKKSGLWDSAYTNKVRDRIPSDLKKALMNDANAWDNFRGFANSYRNMYIGWVKTAKTKETRAKRISKVVGQSLRNKKQVFE